MRRWWSRLPKLPPGGKICRNLLLSALLLGMIYLLQGAPSFTLKGEFRRVERQNLVGPSEILAVIPVKDPYYDRLLVADDGAAVILYPTDGKSRFYYWDKTGELTVVAAHSDVWSTELEQVTLLLFHQEKRAAWAELDISLTSQLNGREFARDYTLKSQKEWEGFFVFQLERSVEPSQVDGEYTPLAQSESYAFCELMRLWDNRGWSSYTAPAEVRIYDRQGKLLRQEAMVLSTPCRK